MAKYPFETTSDSLSNESLKGLTSDSTSDGGVLAPPVFVVESGIFNTTSATTIATSDATATESGVFVQSSASPFSTEIGSSSVTTTIVSADANTVASEFAVAFDGGYRTADASTDITEFAAATESAILTASATTYASDFAVAFPTDVYVDAYAETTTIYIPPLPKFGIFADQNDAGIEYRRSDTI